MLRLSPQRMLIGLLIVLSVPFANSAQAEEIFHESTGHGIDFVHTNGMTGRYYYLEVVGSGGALFDYDGDGDLDVYLVQSALLGGDRTWRDATIPWLGDTPPGDRLYRNDTEREGGPLRFTDVTRETGIVATRYGMGAAAADYDNDGDVDLYVLNWGENQLFRNDGGGKFTDVTEASGTGDALWSVSASFVDMDQDGLLDLYVVNYLDWALIAHKTCLTERGEPDYCLPSNYRPVSDRLYRNLGNGRFEDVSEPSGIAAVRANGLAVVSGDFDADGRTDLYVANDLMPNNLWLNRSSEGTVRFVDDGLMVGAALNRHGKAEASMGLDAADVSDDGRLDLFMTHFRRESNTLFVASGEGATLSFEDQTVEFGLEGPSWDHTSFGTRLVDVDNDGDLDLVVANGAVTYLPGQDRTAKAFPLDEPNQLFLNQRVDDRTRFVPVPLAKVEDPGVSRSTLIGDLDNDGDSDLIVTNNSGAPHVLENRLGQDAAWIGLELRAGKRDAQGAVVTLPDLGGLPRVARSDGGYAASDDPRLILGLGETAKAPERIRPVVLWPSGRKERFGPLAGGRYHRLLEGTGTISP